MRSASAPDLAVLLGHFQPLRRDHLWLFEHALSLAPRALVVVGAAAGPRLAKAPFTEAERIDCITASLSPEQRRRVAFACVRDYYDEPRWAGAVRSVVARENAGSVALVGFRIDQSSPSWFPEWSQHALPRSVDDGPALRHAYFTHAEAELAPELLAAVPPPTARFLLNFQGSQAYAHLRDEWLSLEANRQKYGTGVSVTVDSLVTAAGQVLLVQRGNAPCKGLWALPGGFLEGSERLLRGALRELREETDIAESEVALRNALRSVAVFDHPRRSQRGRSITHVHHFALAGEPPSVAGADDALAARWFTLEQVASMSRELCEDHFQIIDHFLCIARD